MRTKNRSCTGKAKYTRKQAAGVARSRLGNYGSYKCKFCGFFHVGHNPKRRKTRWR